MRQEHPEFTSVQGFTTWKALHPALASKSFQKNNLSEVALFASSAEHQNALKTCFKAWPAPETLPPQVQGCPVDDEMVLHFYSAPHTTVRLPKREHEIWGQQTGNTQHMSSLFQTLLQRMSQKTRVKLVSSSTTAASSSKNIKQVALFSTPSQIPKGWTVEGQLRSASHREQLGDTSTAQGKMGPALVLVGPRDEANKVPIVLHRSLSNHLDMQSTQMWNRLDPSDKARVCIAPQHTSAVLYAVQRRWAFVVTDVTQNLPQNHRAILRTENLQPAVIASKGLSSCNKKRLQILLQSLNSDEQAQSIFAESGFYRFIPKDPSSPVLPQNPLSRNTDLALPECDTFSTSTKSISIRDKQ